MREASKTASKAVRTLTNDEILAVSGGAPFPIKHGDGLGGLRRALGGGLLGQIATQVVHAGRRAARDLPFPIL